MTAEPRPPRPDRGARDTAEDDALLDVAYEGDEYGGEEFEEFDDLDEERDAPEPRGWPLGALFALAVGVWIGRWFLQLPQAAGETAGLVHVVATAILGAALYRRWVRRQMAQARARRVRR